MAALAFMLVLVAAGRSAPWWPPVVVSCLALVFTVGSFWWIQVRRGRIECAAPPMSYALLSTKETFLLHLPLCLHNTGPAPIVVANLRLRLAGLRAPAPWAISRSTFYATGGSDHAFPFSFVVAGRAAMERFAEFKLEFPEFELTRNTKYKIVVEIKTDSKAKWRELIAFDLNVPVAANVGAFLPHSNDPEVYDVLPRFH